jgi:hypothetical protein
MGKINAEKNFSTGYGGSLCQKMQMPVLGKRSAGE